MAFFIKDLNKKRMQQHAIEDILDRTCRPMYDDVMKKASGQTKRLEEMLKSVGFETGVKKVEIRRPEDLNKVATPTSVQGAAELDKSQLKESYINVSVNPNNFNDVKVGGIKKG